jgi:putative DNA-invertase from lambdoid prophage Rac
MLTKLAAVGDMERDLLVDRTQAGLAGAKKEGKTPGRPAKTSEAQRKDILNLYRAGSTISELARQSGLSRLNIARITKSLFQ